MTIQEQIDLIKSRQQNPTIYDIIRSDALCEAYGINPWCVNEGLANGEEILNTEQRIKELEEYCL